MQSFRAITVASYPVSGGIAAILWAAALVAGAGTASAQTYTGRMAVRQVVEHDSNPLMLTTSPRAVTGSHTAPEATIVGETDQAKVELNARVVGNLYSDESFNSTDGYLWASAAHQGETVKLGVIATVDYDTTLSSELTGSGVVVAGVRHKQQSLTPRLDILLSPVDVVSGVASYARTEYNSTLYTDYEEWNFTPSYSHAFTPLDTGRVSIIANRFATLTGGDAEVNSIGVVAGWDRWLMERLKLSGFFGGRLSNSSDSTGKRSSSGYLADIALRYEGQQDVFQLSLDRNLTPLGTGTQVQTDRIDGMWVREITPLAFAELRLQYLQQSSLDNNPDQDRTYYSVEPGIRFQLTEGLDIGPLYRLRHQVTGRNDDKASSHAVLLTIGYRGGKLDLE